MMVCEAHPGMFQYPDTKSDEERSDKEGSKGDGVG